MVEIIMLGVASIILLILYLFFVVLSPEKREAAQNEGLEDFKKWSARRHEEWKKTGKRAYPGFWITGEGPTETSWREDLDAPAEMLADFVNEDGIICGTIDPEEPTRMYLLPPSSVEEISDKLSMHGHGGLACASWWIMNGPNPPGSLLMPHEVNGEWINPDGTPWVYDKKQKSST